MQALGEEALLEVEADALDRVDFGRIGRQGDQRDVVGCGQVVGLVPAGLIEHHRHVLVFADRGGEAVAELLHRLLACGMTRAKPLSAPGSIAAKM